MNNMVNTFDNSEDIRILILQELEDKLPHPEYERLASQLIRYRKMVLRDVQWMMELMLLENSKKEG